MLINLCHETKATCTFKQHIYKNFVLLVTFESSRTQSRALLQKLALLILAPSPSPQQPDFDQQVLRGGEPRELVACRDQHPGFSAPPAADAVATANWVLGDVLFVMSLVLVMHLVVDLKYSYYQGESYSTSSALLPSPRL